MLTKTKVIVLHTLKYGDKKLFVEVFSREYGTMMFSCPQGARGKQKSKANYFQPLSILEVEFDMKPKVDIHAIKDVRIDYPAGSIPFDPYKLSISIFLADFLRYSLANEQRNCPLYDYIEYSIQWLDTARGDFANFHIVFMVKFSQFIGFYPNVEEFSPGCFFDMQAGCFISTMPTHKCVIRPSDATIIPVLARLNFFSMRLLRLSRNERNDITDGVLQYYRLHLPGFPELKSFAVMRELFA